MPLLTSSTPTDTLTSRDGWPPCATRGRCLSSASTTAGPPGHRASAWLDLHPDWVYEAGLSVHRRGHVIRVAGELDTLDGEVLVRSLNRMTKELDADRVLALDLRRVDALTDSGACRALLEGARGVRERSGRVRCGLPGWQPR